MGRLTRKILSALAGLPEGFGQRIDGLRCEREILDESSMAFHTALWIACRRGWVKRWSKTHSIFASANALPFYSITEAGRAALNGGSHDE